MPCDVEESHAHYYVNDDNIGRYVVSEKSFIWGLNRLDDYILVNEEEKKLLEFINKKNLYSIADNKEAIDNITVNQVDFKEYRYSYHYIVPSPVTYSDGKNVYVLYNYVPMTGYSWTSDSSKEDLTGEERICHYVYYGYKLTKNDKGDYELEKSEPVDSIAELPENYDYIEEDFYNIVNLYNKDEIIDYEDGPEEEKASIKDEEYNLYGQRQGKK